MNLPILELVKLNTCGCVVVQLVNIFNFVECEWTSTMNERSAVMNQMMVYRQTNKQTYKQTKQNKSKKTNKKNSMQTRITT